MNEYILVEFIASNEIEDIKLSTILKDLGSEFIYITKTIDTHWDNTIKIRIKGKITPEYASLIKLTDPFLAERMRISYIPDELKDKYRR